MMKTTSRKLALTLFGLLAAGILMPVLPLPAQNVKQQTQRTIDSNVRRNPKAKDKKRSSLRNTEEKWYLEMMPAYVSSDANMNKFYGASISMGWRIGKEDKVQLEIGYYKSNDYSSAYSYNRDGTGEGVGAGVYYYGGTAGVGTASPFRVDNQGYAITMNGTQNAKGTMMPVLISYSYCIQWGSTGRFGMRLTPVAGLIIMSDTWDVNATGSFTAPPGTVIDTVSPTAGSTIAVDGSRIDRTESFSGKDSNYIASALGGGFALTYNFNSRWYAEAGYRYIWTGITANKENLTTATGTPWNGVMAWNGMNNHYYFATLGWKF